MFYFFFVSARERIERENVKMNVHLRTFFFISCSFFMNCRYIICMCWFNGTHRYRFSRRICPFCWSPCYGTSYIGPHKLYSIFCAELFYCFSENPIWLTRLQLIGRMQIGRRRNGNFFGKKKREKRFILVVSLQWWTSKIEQCKS